MYSDLLTDHRKRGIIDIIGDVGNITPIAPGATIPDMGAINPSSAREKHETKRKIH